jgi:hypothetical protein
MPNPPFVNAAVHVVGAGEFLDGEKRALDAVLVKAIAPVCAAIVGTALAVDFTAPALSRHGLRRVDRVMIDVAAEDLVRVQRPSRDSDVSRNLHGGVQRLKNVHVVGDGDASYCSRGRW